MIEAQLVCLELFCGVIIHTDNDNTKYQIISYVHYYNPWIEQRPHKPQLALSVHMVDQMQFRKLQSPHRWVGQIDFRVMKELSNEERRAGNNEIRAVECTHIFFSVKEYSILPLTLPIMLPTSCGKKNQTGSVKIIIRKRLINRYHTDRSRWHRRESARQKLNYILIVSSSDD